MYEPGKAYFGGFLPNDGTVDFYTRVNSLAHSGAVFLDYGAGRSAWVEEDDNPIRHALRTMQGKFGKVIAADVDPVVMGNPTADQCMIITNNKLPLENESVDVIVADYVIEHIDDPNAFAAEISRLLKPGGWFCARTPHRMHYVSLAARLIPQRLEDGLMRYAQPKRKSEDIFPKRYRLNSLGDIAAAFPGWHNQSFCIRTHPAYYFGSRALFYIMALFHHLMPAQFSGNLFVFIQKPTREGSSA